MTDRFETIRRALEEAVLRGPGATSPALRQRVAGNRDVPEVLAPLLEKVRVHAYKVTDEDIAALKGKYTDDELFEIIVSCAVGEAERRMGAVLAALRARRDRAA